MKSKNKDLDRWLTGIRSPYERVFSKESHQARYAGVRQNLFTTLLQSLALT